MDKTVIKLLVTLLLSSSVTFQSNVMAYDLPQQQNDFEQQDYHSRKSSYVPKTGKTKQKKIELYKVRKGDTLYGIAREHGVSPEEITRLNNLSSGDRLLSGMKIRIPADKGVVECFAKTEEDEKPFASSVGFQWPVNPVVGVGRDGEKGVKPIGVIIKSRPGTKVCSAAQGTIEKIGHMRGFGNFIVMRHPDGLMTVYSGLGNVLVREGIRVKKGCSIGNLERNSAELHFMVHKKGKLEDPLKHLPSKKS